MKVFQRIHAALSSVRLAVVLITFIALTAGLAACIPQGRLPEYYIHSFKAAAPVLLLLGFDHFFRSFLFIMPLTLFTLNLLLCTVKRIRRHRGTTTISSYGPDLIHVGILLLIAAGVLTLFLREERQIILAEGQSAQLPGNYIVTLKSFETLRYADGSPRNWRSEIEVFRQGRILSKKTVGVNSPQRVGYLRLYQFSFGSEQTAVIGGWGREIRLAVGERFSYGDETFEVLGMDTKKLTLTLRNSKTGITKVLRLGDSVGVGKIRGFSSRTISVLQGVYDPGFYPAVIALLLVILGLGLTFTPKILQQLKETE